MFNFDFCLHFSVDALLKINVTQTGIRYMYIEA